MEDSLRSDSQPNANGSGFTEDEFISDLLKRQDAVLESLDELNLRIEKAILEIGKARQESSEMAEPVDSSESVEVTPPISKAA